MSLRQVVEATQLSVLTWPLIQPSEKTAAGSGFLSSLQVLPAFVAVVVVERMDWTGSGLCRDP